VPRSKKWLALYILSVAGILVLLAFGVGVWSGLGIYYGFFLEFGWFLVGCILAGFAGAIYLFVSIVMYLQSLFEHSR
jgi:hypothetical protein